MFLQGTFVILITAHSDDLTSNLLMMCLNIQILKEIGAFFTFSKGLLDLVWSMLLAVV